MLPTEIIEAYHDGSLVVVVGPDASVAAGLRSRRELARGLLQVARERGRSEDACAAIESMLAHDLPGAMSALRRELDEPTVRAHVERAFDDRAFAPTALHHAIAALCERVDRLITINLDRLLDRALPTDWARLTEPTTQTRGHRRALFKLHGTLSLVGTWRLTAGRQAELGASAAARGLMEGLFHEQTLLLVGFGAHAAELDALLDLAGAPKDAGDVAVAHVALVPDGVDEPRRVALADRGVRLASVGVAQGPAHLEATAELLRGLLPGGSSGARHSVTSAGARLAEGQTSPFPGLLPFTEDLGEFFHGRTDEVQAALCMLGGPVGLEHTRWLLVEGASGVGKSSFVQAGLLPALRARGIAGGPGRYRVVSLRPGPLPLRALARAVVEEWTPPAPRGQDEARAFEAETEALEAELTTRDDALATYVARRLDDDEGLVLVVDQLEEAMTFASPLHRGPFGAALATALRYSKGRSYLVTTLRSDFVGHLADDLPRLSELLNTHVARYSVGPLSAVGLRAAIEQPALDCGAEIDDGLVESIMNDANDLPRGGEDRRRGPDATLPLVAHVMKVLWGTRGEHDGRLTLSAYEAIGSVAGALTKSADALLLGLGERSLRRVQAMLLQLVAVHEQGRDTKRSASRQDVVAAGADEGEALLQRLSGGAVRPGTIGETAPPLQARVLVVTGEGDQARVDLVHEALLYQWTTLRRWLDAQREELLLREELRRATEEFDTAQWVPHGAKRDYLLRIAPTTEAERAFHRRMQRAARWQRLSNVALVVVLGSAAVGAGRAAWVANEERHQAETARQAEQEQRALAERRLRQAVALADGVVTTINRRLSTVAGAAAVQKELLEAARRLQDALREEAPDDVGVLRGRMLTHTDRGDLAMDHDNLWLARQEYTAALVIADQLAQGQPSDRSYQRQLAMLHNGLGDVAFMEGKLSRARERFEQSLEVTLRLSEADPSDAQVQRDLGVSYDRLGSVELSEGKLSRARERFEQSLEVTLRLSEADSSHVKLQQDLAVSYQRLGDVERAEGKLSRARERFEQALEVAWRLAQADPGNAQLQRELGVAYGQLGAVTALMGDVERARVRFEQSLEVARPLAQAAPDNTQFQRDLGMAYSKLGEVDQEAGNIEQARARHEQALEVWQRLTKADPHSEQFQRDVVVTYVLLGDLETKNLGLARARYEQALEVAQRLIAANPKNVQLARYLVYILQRLGAVELEAGNVGQARASFGRALEVSWRLADANSQDAELQLGVVRSLLGFVELEKRAGDETEALEHLREADRILDAMAATGQIVEYQAYEDAREEVDAELSKLVKQAG